jgi:seryl-tRNA synthetase
MSEMNYLFLQPIPLFSSLAAVHTDTRAQLNRLHQFDKVEIVRVDILISPYEALDGMVEHVNTSWSELEDAIIVFFAFAGGDMGFASALLRF